MRLKIEDELREIRHLGPVGQPKGATVVFGGQAGSEGKGAIGGWLAKRYQWGAAVCTFMPNAGHTWTDGRDEVVVTQLPIGLVSDTVGILGIGASSVINPDKLDEEIDRYEGRYNVASRLRIHPRAQIMLPEYVAWEEENLKYIASTGKGCGAAIAAKARRERGVVLAGSSNLPQEYRWIGAHVADGFDEMLNNMINGGTGILVEQSQGFDLDINHGFEYPYCTSRQCTPTQIMADLGLSERLVTNSIAVVRTKPIRVGNVDGGHSGEYGSKETSWGQVSSSAGRQVEEKTTVTKRVRRVFEFDYERIGVMSKICRPTAIALTFADYIDPNIFQLTQADFTDQHNNSLIVASPDVHQFVYRVEKAVRRSTMNPPVTMIKTGPTDDQTLNMGVSL